LVDCLAVDPSPLWPSLADNELILHNSLFDLTFLSRMGFQPTGPVRDTLIMARLLAAGTGRKCSLDAVLQHYLRIPPGPDLSGSPWGRPVLSREQLDYAAADVRHLVRLHEELKDWIKAGDMQETLALEERCLPAVRWLAGAGVAFDR